MLLSLVLNFFLNNPSRALGKHFYVHYFFSFIMSILKIISIGFGQIDKYIPLTIINELENVLTACYLVLNSGTIKIKSSEIFTILRILGWHNCTRSTISVAFNMSLRSLF